MQEITRRQKRGEHNTRNIIRAKRKSRRIKYINDEKGDNGIIKTTNTKKEATVANECNTKGCERCLLKKPK